MSEHLSYAKEFLGKQPLTQLKPEEVHEAINRLASAIFEVVAYLDEQEQKRAVS
jgi:hypothetical protein